VCEAPNARAHTNENKATDSRPARNTPSTHNLKTARANNDATGPIIELSFGTKALPLAWKGHWVVRYALLTAITVVTALCGFVLAFYALIHGAGRTHDEALFGVLRAPLSFFSANAAGSVLNRFSGDQRAVDDDLPDTLVDLWAGLMGQVASFALAIFAFPPVAAAIVPSMCMLWWLRTLYIRASAQAQRMEAAARSPVVAQMRSMVEVRRGWGPKPRNAPRTRSGACAAAGNQPLAGPVTPHCCPQAEAKPPQPGSHNTHP
jgi:hypothetical protein